MNPRWNQHNLHGDQPKYSEKKRENAIAVVGTNHNKRSIWPSKKSKNLCRNFLENLVTINPTIKMKHNTARKVAKFIAATAIDSSG